MVLVPIFSLNYNSFFTGKKKFKYLPSNIGITMLLFGLILLSPQISIYISQYQYSAAVDLILIFLGTPLEWYLFVAV